MKVFEEIRDGTANSLIDLAFPHGMPTTHAEQINADLLEFIKK
jgi:hypothetical protein